MIEAGPVERSGAIGSILSIYFLDQDENTIEVANALGGAGRAPRRG
jgi:hypothetical protein